MKARVLPFLLVALIGSGRVSSWAQAERSPAGDGRTLELVDQLKEVIQRWDGNRTANPALLNQLRDLVRRYDWPWRIKLFFDNFKDGDYARNPAWIVIRGEFSVAPGFGLRTIVESPSASPPTAVDRRLEPAPADIIGAVLKDMTASRGATVPLRDRLGAAEISTSVAIGNAFAIRARMLSQEKAVAAARIEFGPYRGNGREWGYRLAYNPGRRPSFEILRLSPGRASVVETYNVFVELEDGKAHEVEWRRDRDGGMLVFLDGKEIVRTVDRATSEFFDGFTIVNLGGDFSFEEIEILGADS